MSSTQPVLGGRYDFDDGGTYCGQWEEGKAHGHGVCTGPKGQGEYSGAWHYGYEVSGVYTWPSGNMYEGQWQNGKRHGLGVEYKGRWIYRGEWTQGFPGRYGVRLCKNSQARFEGTWANGLQDGYGTETYADGGLYQGQWLRGMRHGYGIRRSVPYGVAAKFRSKSQAHASLTSLRSDHEDEGGGGGEAATAISDHKEKTADKDKKLPDDSRGGFVLRARSEPPTRRRSLSERSLAVKKTLLQGLRIKKQKSTGDIHQRVVSGGTGSIRSSGSTGSCASDESALTGYSRDANYAPEEPIDPNVTETYMGEWKNDRRSGFGISERSDGLKYEGEWFNNKKFGYGVTTLKDGSKEEGKYKNNVLITSQRRKNLVFVRSSKLKERIEAAVAAANRAAQLAMQKTDISLTRSATARDKAEQADVAATAAREDSDVARLYAKQYAPDFQQPGTELLKLKRQEMNHVPYNATPPSSQQDTARAPNNSASARSKSTLISPARPPDAYDTTLQHSQRTDFKPIETTIEAPPSMQPHPLLSGADAMHAANQNAAYALQHNHPSVDERYAQQQFIPGAEAAHGRRSSRMHPADEGRLLPSNYVGHAADVHNPGPMHSLMPRGSQYTAYAGAVEPGGSPGVSRTPSQSSSRYSVNQLINDHFDQYAMAANPGAARMQHAAHHGQQGDPQQLAAALQRRSTLASAQDYRALQGAVPALMASNAVPVYNSATGGGTGELVRRRPPPLEHLPSMMRSESKQSLPDSSALDKAPVQLSREEVARLSSQRREELHRLREEEELLRGNPLRYLFHPAVREWIARRKLMLLIIAVNFSLSILFYRLLSFPRDGDGGDGEADE